MKDNGAFFIPAGLAAHQKKAEAEFEAYYSSFDSCADSLVNQLNAMLDAAEGESAYEKKTRVYELLAEACPVHLFRETDFFFEMASGRPRYSWGGLSSPAGCILHSRTQELWLNPYGKALEKEREEDYIRNWNNPVSIDHHCPGYDKLLTLGVNGIIAEAEKALAACEDGKKRDFYGCVIRANRALLRLAGRFEAEARRLAGEAQDEETRRHYLKIAEAASNVPANPPRTFYEGLCAIFFYRECVGSMEGVGFSILGLLDRMLCPLYRADLAAGRVTHEEAHRLLCDLLIYTDMRFSVHDVFRETSTTIEIGGCDRDGNVIYNEITEMILDAVAAVRSVNTKINCRISKAHPKEYLEKIARVQLENLPTLMMHNDDVLITSRVRRGQAAEDARMYVGGGCHEIVLQNTEVCNRADTWINLPRLLLKTMEDNRGCADFETFLSRFIADVRAFHDKVAGIKNRYAADWGKYDPLVLYSSTMADSLEKGLDITEGGARYNSDSLSMLGTATLIDSLYAVKTLVFDEHELTMDGYLDILKRNFEGDEPLRQRIVKKLPKHGTNSPELNDFSARVLSNLAEVSGQKNARGGYFLPAFYPHDVFRTMGEAMGATPDGRLAGWPLSRGVSPSEFVETSPLDLIQSLKAIDFTGFAESFCAEVTLPRMENKAAGLPVLMSLIEAFLQNEGSSLQFNLMDHAEMVDAQAHPERHGSLTVRVCGYSASFVTLHKDVQDEVIDRAIR